MQIFIFREDPLAAVFFVEAESPPSESPLKGSGLSWTTRESWKRVEFLSCWCLDWLKLAYLINKRDGEALFSSIYSNCSNHLVEMVYPFGDLSWQLSVIKGKWHNLQVLISQVWFRKGTVQSVHSIPCLSPQSRSVFGATLPGVGNTFGSFKRLVAQWHEFSPVFCSSKPWARQQKQVLTHCNVAVCPTSGHLDDLASATSLSRSKGKTMSTLAGPEMHRNAGDGNHAKTSGWQTHILCAAWICCLFTMEDSSGPTYFTCKKTSGYDGLVSFLLHV